MFKADPHSAHRTTTTQLPQQTQLLRRLVELQAAQLDALARISAQLDQLQRQP